MVGKSSIAAFRKPDLVSPVYSLLTITPAKVVDFLTQNVEYAVNGALDELMEKMIDAEELDIEYGNEVHVMENKSHPTNR